MQEEKFVSIFPYNGKQYLQNVAFDSQKNKGIERSIFLTLKKYLNERNININTYDISIKKAPYKYVYFDLPYPWNFSAWKLIITNRNKNILICNEASLTMPFNYWKILHIFFTKVYTWYDELVDNRKYFKILLPKSSIGVETKPKKFGEKKFLVLINKNTLPFFPFQLLKSFGRELYSERIKSMEFFENAIPDRFFIYGRGWNKPKKYNLTEKIFGFKKYSNYKGEADDKIKLLSNFKYCLCFENLTDVNGDITEKIFDCLKAKCVPIYWGATDVEKYIPKNCFIDFRDFKDYQKLLGYINSISEDEYNEYIKNIKYLLSEKKFIETWFEDSFAKFFYENILEMRDYEKN